MAQHLQKFISLDTLGSRNGIGTGLGLTTVDDLNPALPLNYGNHGIFLILGP